MAQAEAFLRKPVRAEWPCTAVVRGERQGRPMADSAPVDRSGDREAVQRFLQWVDEQPDVAVCRSIEPEPVMRRYLGVPDVPLAVGGLFDVAKRLLTIGLAGILGGAMLGALVAPPRTVGCGGRRQSFSSLLVWLVLVWASAAGCWAYATRSSRPRNGRLQECCMVA